MDAEFTDEQEQLRDAVRRFLADKAPVRPYVRDMLDDPDGFSVDVWHGLAALGATGLAIDPSLGGAGGDLIDVGVVLEEWGRAVQPGPYLSTAVGATTLLNDLAATTPNATTGALLTVIATGTATAAVVLPAHIDPTDPIQVRGGTPRDGGTIELHGRATFVRDVAAADTIIAVAADPSNDEAFVVASIDGDAPGVGLHEVPTIDGTARWADVRLDGVTAQVLSAERDAIAAAVARTIDALHVGAVVDGVGAAEAALGIAVDYAKERRQFGVPIGSFQAVQHLCADMLRDVEVTRASAYYALWCLDHADADERRLAATMALAHAGDALARVGASTIQVLGGIGFTWEHDAHLYSKRLMTLQQLDGGSTVHLHELAELVIDAS